MSANTENQETKQERGRVVSVSVPSSRRAAFDDALATLKRHHKDPFIQAAPLIVETIIEAARRVRAEEYEHKFLGGEGEGGSHAHTGL